MRTLLILLKREIIDHVAYFVCAAIASGITIGLIAPMVLSTDKNLPSIILAGGLMPIAICVLVGLTALGVSQTLSDRTRGISAFLMALPVTRGRIFVTRLLAGVLAISVLMVPLAIAGRTLINLRVSEVQPYPGLLADLLWGISLTCLACYAVGLHVGGSAKSVAPTLVVLPATALIPFLILAKGFGGELIGLLLVFNAACLLGTWFKFSKSLL
jgi:hypothetical protein